MEQNAAELYKEREKRVNDAIALRVPDRVPIMALFGFFPAKYSGMTVEQVMYDPEKLLQAQMKTLLEFQPDMEQNPFGLRFLGPILEALDFTQLRWPGHGISLMISRREVQSPSHNGHGFKSSLIKATISSRSVGQ